jgi:hypothetical protein
MSFWSSLLKKTPAAPTAPGQTDREPEPLVLPASVARLARIGESHGPSEQEALALLRSIRSTPDEGMALDALVQQNRLKALPQSITLAVAGALVDRGDRASAQALLSTNDGTGALLVRADLFAEDGDFASAVATIERTLLRDLDLGGARERWLRWRAKLGLVTPEARVELATMTIATPNAKAPFDLVREVARGGAGVVFAAKDRELGRTIALKVYHRPERDLEQLLHEARVATALEGPGIVRVFDVEPDDGWLALEWASLGALRDLLRATSRDGATEPAAMLRSLQDWLPDLARALARVHAAGWVHHDIKPANVLMHAGADGSGRTLVSPWLGDFGSARRGGEPSPPGSLGYLSPERIAGRASDPRDDVYGLGRVIEDVLVALADVEGAADWRALAASCVGPDAARPRDGSEVVERIALISRPFA